jgi:hypothetical protein
MKIHHSKEAAALAGVAILFVAATSAHAYDPNYKRSQCDAYTFHGLNERYVFGGHVGWIDNDVWDSSSTEGTDCSDYVPRCLALPNLQGEHTATGHPYYTGSMYTGIANTVQGSLSSLQQWDFFVWHNYSTGDGHTGFIRTWDASNVYTREARGTAYGVVSVTRSRQSIIDNGGRIWRRAGWGAESSAVTVDNSSAGFSVVGTWATASSSTDKYGADYRYHSTQPVSEPATWSASVSGGTHSVYAWWAQGSNRSTTAPYIVYHGSGTTTVNKNQQVGGGSWQLLGTWGDFVAGNNQVKLSCWTGTGFVVIADAIKWQ